jgi:cation transport ATPase
MQQSPDSDVEALRKVHAEFSTAQLIDLLLKPSDLRPEAEALIRTELDKRGVTAEEAKLNVALMKAEDLSQRERSHRKFLVSIVVAIAVSVGSAIGVIIGEHVPRWLRDTVKFSVFVGVFVALGAVAYAVITKREQRCRVCPNCEAGNDPFVFSKYDLVPKSKQCP